MRRRRAPQTSDSISMELCAFIPLTPLPARTSFSMCFILFLICLLPALGLGQSASQNRQKCLSPDAAKSCGACIAASPDCAWCSDLRFNSSAQRCDAKWELAKDGRCAERQIFSPSTEIKVAPQHNLPLGSRRADGVTVIQLEPQQVEIRMKPGDIVEVPFRYLHKLPLSGYEVRDFTIQTSEFRSLGVDIEFSVDCNGERIVGRVCPGVRPEQKISFYAKVSLADCSRPQLAAISVGIYGYNTVSAIFVTPLCGCECEQPRHHERRSPRCSYAGNLVCGSCQCDPGKGGERCECDLDKYGVSNADELVGLCREHNKAPICSAKGKCQCGQCQCQADYISGRYCECDNTNCPLGVDGRMCSGRGACQCGKCVCEHGYSGEDCTCDDDPGQCAENGVICFENGYCECGKCSCNVGWTGAKCNIPVPLPEESTPSDGVPTSTTTTEESESAESSEEESESTSTEDTNNNKSAELLPTHGGGENGGQDAQQAEQSAADAAAQQAALLPFWPALLATTLALFLGFFRLSQAQPWE